MTPRVDSIAWLLGCVVAWIGGEGKRSRMLCADASMTQAHLAVEAVLRKLGQHRVARLQTRQQLPGMGFVHGVHHTGGVQRPAHIGLEVRAWVYELLSAQLAVE
jgi:hypothetical protein